MYTAKTATYHSEVFKRPSSLNVVQSLLQVNQLSLDLALSLLSALHSLGLKGIDSLNLTANIVGRRLEALEVALDLVNDGLVLQHVAVVGEVDGLRLLGKSLDLAARFVVTLLEGLQGGGRLAAEAERAGHLGPVEFESGTALNERLKLADHISRHWASKMRLRGDICTYSCHYEEWFIVETWKRGGQTGKLGGSDR